MALRSENEANSFTETHWALHRNAIFLSTLTIIVCISRIEPKQSIDQINIVWTNELSRAAPILVWIGASYSFFACFVEWVRGPVTQLKLELEGFKNLREEIGKSIDSAFEPVQALQSSFVATFAKLSQVRDRLEGWSGEFKPDSNRQLATLTPEFDPSLNKRINDIFRSHARELGMSTEGVKNELTSEFQKLIKNREDAVALSLKSEILEALIASNQAIASLDIKIDSLKAEKIDKISINPLLTSIQRASKLENIRTIWIGLAVPIILYATATLHLIGKLWFGCLPNVAQFVNLLYR